MPIINCPDCSKEMSDAAPLCPNCGRPNPSVKPAEPTERKVSLLLGLGILLLPVIFTWFTLRKGHSMMARALSFAWLFLLIAISFADGIDPTPPSSASSSSSSSSENYEAPTAMAVDIRQILGDYEGNEVAADNRYKGRLIEVTGIVDDIKKDLMDNLYVTLGTGKQFEIPKIQAFFDDSMNNQLGQLRKGQRLTVVCTVKGLMMNVLAEECVIK